jgi:hypothetical protein
MKIKTTILMFALIAGVTFAPSVNEASAQTSASNQASQSAGTQKSLTGVVSDAMCGKTHMAKDKTAAECTRMCVQQGQKYALVVGQKVYTLEGHEDDLNKLAGERVSIKGKISGDTVTVSSVTAAKKKTT